MQFSNEIIQILEYLGSKIGITFDWTNENVLPYVEQLGKTFIEWEFCTSLTWIILMACLSILAFIFAISAENLEGFEWFCFWFIAILSVIVISYQIFDMVTCRVFPEKIIYDCILMYFKK